MMTSISSEDAFIDFADRRSMSAFGHGISSLDLGDAFGAFQQIAIRAHIATHETEFIYENEFGFVKMTVAYDGFKWEGEFKN